MSQEITTELQGESLLPKESGYIRKMFPRITFVSQDKTEGKGKNMTVVEEAGTFFTEKQTDELNEKGKKKWSHEEVGKSFEGVIFFTRKKLSFFDSAAAKYITSSYYDQDTDIIPLWQDGKKIAEGTKAELQEPYRYEEEGKKKCKLQENKILYIYYEGEVFEMTIKGTSMFEYSGYYKTWNAEPNKNLTLISSVEAENGATRWNKTTYARVRQLTQEEWDITRSLAAEMISGIMEEKSYFAPVNTDVPADEWAIDTPKVLTDGKDF